MCWVVCVLGQASCTRPYCEHRPRRQSMMLPRTREPGEWFGIEGADHMTRGLKPSSMALLTLVPPLPTAGMAFAAAADITLELT